MFENLGPRLQAWAAAHTPSAVKIVLILALAWLLSRLSAALIRRFEVFAEDDDPNTVSEAEKRARTLGRILRQVSMVLICIIAAMLILGEVGIDLKPILAGSIAFTRKIDEAAACMYALQNVVLKAQGIPIQGHGRQAYRS